MDKEYIVYSVVWLSKDGRETLDSCGTFFNKDQSEDYAKNVNMKCFMLKMLI